MAKIVNVTLPDESHALLEKIKKRKNLPNNSEALIWIIKKAAGIGE
jgi:hypothetical protein